MEIHTYVLHMYKEMSMVLKVALKGFALGGCIPSRINHLGAGQRCSKQATTAVAHKLYSHCLLRSAFEICPSKTRRGIEQ